MINKEEMLNLLHADIIPAFGCTEPVCVALAAADAAKTIDGDIKKIDLEINPNIYKNGMAVGIPNFDRIGLKYAAALGAYLKTPEKGLRILDSITPEIADFAITLVENNAVNMTIREEEHSLYVKCNIMTDDDTGCSIIRDSHTNIILTQKNGLTISSQNSSTATGNNPILDKLKQMTIKEMRLLAESASINELSFLLDGTNMNNTLADFALNNQIGIGITSTLKKYSGSKYIGNSLMERIMLRVASATEGRLSGSPYAAMSSAGSGTKGIAITLSILEVAREIKADDITLMRTLAFAHLLNNYIHTYIGRLSPVCGCTIAAATASSAAIVMIMGGTTEQMGWAIRNMTGNITGTICDGAKIGCSLKLATSSEAGFISALLALNETVLSETNGICASTPEDCIKNIGRIANQGMLHTDKEILNIMQEKTFCNY